MTIHNAKWVFLQSNELNALFNICELVTQKPCGIYYKCPFDYKYKTWLKRLLKLDEGMEQNLWI